VIQKGIIICFIWTRWGGFVRPRLLLSRPFFRCVCVCDVFVCVCVMCVMCVCAHSYEAVFQVCVCVYVCDVRVMCLMCV